ncbi:MAG: hypothetical protein IPI93_05835 [Sphingobacteriaceae bacterium]|nr:hypothetical protein [Sphingobacteriaceae bacterium]
MKNFDKFDESVKNKLDEANFQFNEANWEKMSQMIDASRPAKKPFGNVPLISSIVIGSALLISSAWYFTTQTSDSKEVAQNNTTAVSINPTKNTDANTANTTLASDNSNTNASSHNSNTNLKVTNNSNSSSAIIEKEELPAKNETSAIVNSSSTKKNVASKKSNTTSANEFATTTKASLEVKVAKSEASNSDAQEVVGETEGAHVKMDANNTTNIPSNTDASKTNNNPKGNTKTESENIAQQKAAGDDRNITATDVEETDMIALPSTTTNLGQTEDAIAAANLKTAIEDKKVKEYVRVKHHTLNIEAGASNSFGWKVNNTRNGNNISPMLGINYMYNIDSRSSLLVGLQYNGLSNLGEAKANFSITTYGFGVNNDVTTYKLNDLHYAVMPMKFIYKFNKNNALGVGFNMMYLMNTRTEIINTTTLESNLTTSNSRFEYGYGFDQLNKFNGQLALNYNYNISKTLGLNLEINKSLGNVVKDYTYFGIKNQNSSPAAVKLSLTYTLFNK